MSDKAALIEIKIKLEFFSLRLKDLLRNKKKLDDPSVSDIISIADDYLMSAGEQYEKFVKPVPKYNNGHLSGTIEKFFYKYKNVIVAYNKAIENSKNPELVKSPEDEVFAIVIKNNSLIRNELEYDFNEILKKMNCIYIRPQIQNSLR